MSMTLACALRKNCWNTNPNRPPQSADVEEMLGIAYDIRSRRSHVLEDLGRQAWVFSDGAEVAFEPTLDRIFTLAGLWRPVRHVVREYVAAAPKVDDEPWDYRMALPGIVTAKLALQLWVGADLDAAHSLARLDGVAEALIAWHAKGQSPDNGFNLVPVAARVEHLVPSLTDSPERTALVAIHRLWYEWGDPSSHTTDGTAFAAAYEWLLSEPSPTAFTVAVLSNFEPREWTTQEWLDLALGRRAARLGGKEAPLPPKIDALLQLEASDRLEGEGRHAEAVTCASYAVEEVPGDEMLLAWEARLVGGDHDPALDVHLFLFGRSGSEPDPTPEDEH